MATKIPCGGFGFDENSFEFTNDRTLKLKTTTGAGGTIPDMSGFLKADGSIKIAGTIDMDGHNLINITTIGGVHPTNDKIGFENEVDMGQHKIINVSNPSKDMDVVNKAYVDNIKTAIDKEIELLKARIEELENNHPKS